MLRVLADKIIKEAKVSGSIVKIDHFINHQIDTYMVDRIGLDIAKEFPDATKVLTIETAGIVFAGSVARALGHLPMVFAKKSSSALTTGHYYYADVFSFTRKTTSVIRVDQEYLNSEDKVVIIDDFLANGEACKGLISLCNQAGAEVIGIGIVVEKGFQNGRQALEEMGIPVYSCTNIEKIEDGKIWIK